MSRIRSRDTKPELILRKHLWSLGYRYRIRSTLFGKPDLVFSRSRVAIFVDGCFWHKCPDHFRCPATRTKFWTDKINRNARRDRLVTKRLESKGWEVLRFWEHEVIQAVDDVVQTIETALQSNSISER